MTIINFTNKTIITETPVKTRKAGTPITDRISSKLYSTFSNLNFAGVYRIGSKSDYRDCYIGSCYNITLKVTHHLNLLYRGEHHSKELQDWVTKNGIENVDVSVLAFAKPNPDDFEGKEQYFLNLIKPRFNSVLNKRKTTIEFIDVEHRRYCNLKHKNEFGNSIISPISVNYKHKLMKVVLDKYNEDEQRRRKRPTIIIDTEDYSSIIRGEMTKVMRSKELPKNEGFVVRKAFFSKPQ